MDPKKSQDQMLYLITALLRDVQTLNSGVISPESLRKDVRKIVNRFAMEGQGFITKQLPRLGKAFDSALSGKTCLNAAELGFKTQESGCLPMLMEGLFSRVFSNDGRVLPEPCISSIKAIRQVLYSFYKYKLPYDPETENAVVQKFVRTEVDVTAVSSTLCRWAEYIDAGLTDREWNKTHERDVKLLTRARLLVWRLFAKFDIHDIVPRHGPGAVSTKERLWNKWRFTKVSPRIAETYPLDEYFFSSLSHVADRLQDLWQIELVESPARVVLVPKDSRGPRLISAESLANQWIQQGLGRAMMKHIERHPLTRDNVHFTDQGPNQRGALLGSSTGKYATLDLNEASDRISVGLVNVLFSEPLKTALLNCRSLATVLPSGEILTQNKYAPMGSALCFPVLATCVWALLTAAAQDADPTNERDLTGRILVYGDDVVVPTEFVGHATNALERVGLKINHDKSYTTGFFRESCGVDAYKGVNVTPVRFRTVWSSHRSPEVLTSWCAYANRFYKNSYFYTYEKIAGDLLEVYRQIPEVREELPYPSLYEVPLTHRPITRINQDFQLREYLVWESRARVIEFDGMDGWLKLFRYLIETNGRPSSVMDEDGVIRPNSSLAYDYLDANDNGRCVVWDCLDPLGPDEPFRVCSYTRPRANKLTRGWRSRSGKLVSVRK